MALLDHKIEERIYPSPFYYSDQVKLFVYTNSLDVKEPAFIDEIAGDSWAGCIVYTQYGKFFRCIHSHRKSKLGVYTDIICFF